MKEIVASLLLGICTLVASSQITLEKEFLSAEDIGIARLKNAGDKYYSLILSEDEKQCDIMIYNTDFSLMKKIEVTSEMIYSGATSLWIESMSFSEELFDKDIGIEVLFSAGSGYMNNDNLVYQEMVVVIDDDGSVLFKTEGFIYLEDCPSCGVKMIDNEAKLIIKNGWDTNTGFKIYSLPGDLHLKCTSQYAINFPI